MHDIIDASVLYQNKCTGKDNAMKKKLPVGIDNFEEIIREDFYYVDKTVLITELLSNWGKVNLFTRPRRFGKTLNMSMLQCFFEIGHDKKVFDGLNISREKELCEQYMGQFPVISISLKDAGGMTFQAALASIRNIIGREALRFQFLLESSSLSEEEKKMYTQLIKVDEKQNTIFSMPADALEAGLRTLSFLLSKHYDHRVLILIDEYDVPLDKAFQNHYYPEMVSLIRNMFSMALKGNDSLYFAVLTGCLRISKESIFTGLNNMKVLTVTDVRYDEYFGFTDGDVRKLLSYYDLSERYEDVREWYDGYLFGNVAVYCPWDVISFCDEACVNPSVKPKSYWINTSSNSIVKRFINKATRKTQNELEKLIAGESVRKEIHQELTYEDLDKSIDHLWSILFTTGYLTRQETDDEYEYLLRIPNQEIRQIFIMQIKEWFSEITAKDMPALNAFCTAFKKADTETIEAMFNAYLKKTISIRDTSVPHSKKENFYHGILLGLFAHMDDWDVWSNAESGDGYSDILIEIEEESIGIIIEVKYGENGALKTGCEEALNQIENRNYAESLIDDGMTTILKYGIACYHKRCMVMLQ